MTPLTRAERAAIRERAEKATPGPWKADTGLGCKEIKGAKCGPHKQAQYSEIAYTVGLQNDERDAANAILIAAAPTLLATCDALEAENERLREALQGLFDVAVAMNFEPDPGQPHPMKDGIFDKWLDKARAALGDAP